MTSVLAIQDSTAELQRRVPHLDPVGPLESVREGQVFWGRSPAMTELRRRLGDSRARTAGPRIVAATNVDLAQLVREGRFRHDLYMRLNPATRVRVPALRERKDDLPELIRFAFAEAVRCAPLALVDGPGVPATFIPERAMQRLVAHPWPGNHRELKLFALNALVFS